MIVPLLAAGLCVVGFRLLPRLRAQRACVESAAARGRVSVIIPARNEAHNLPKLLGSLRAATGGPCEVLVVDDDSTDGTAAIAVEHGARVIRPGEPPAGWHGKTWACHQGALRAQGEVFCFLDADTWLADDGSWSRLAAAAGDGVFSVCPWHEVARPYESLSLFFNLNMVLGTVPDGLFGQVLWICREAYERCGGHEAVAGRVLENHALAGHCRDAGMQVRSAPGIGLLSFRMYPTGLRDLVAGWRKGFAAGAGATPGWVMAAIVVWMHGLMLALIAVALSPSSVLAWSVYGFAVLQVGLFARRVGSFPWWVAVVYPVPLVFFFGLFGWAKSSSGKPVTWKGRRIHAD